MKFIKILLSLHSMQLIFISALAITYLAVTSTTGSNKTETEQREAAIGYEANGKIDVEAIASQTTDLELDSESYRSWKTALVAGQVDSIIKTERVAERTENEGGSVIDPLFFEREAIKSNGLPAQPETLEDVWMTRQALCSVTNSQC